MEKNTKKTIAIVTAAAIGAGGLGSALTCGLNRQRDDSYLNDSTTQSIVGTTEPTTVKTLVLGEGFTEADAPEIARMIYSKTDKKISEKDILDIIYLVNEKYGKISFVNSFFTAGDYNSKQEKYSVKFYKQFIELLQKVYILFQNKEISANYLFFTPYTEVSNFDNILKTSSDVNKMDAAASDMLNINGLSYPQKFAIKNYIVLKLSGLKNSKYNNSKVLNTNDETKHIESYLTVFIETTYKKKINFSKLKEYCDGLNQSKEGNYNFDGTPYTSSGSGSKGSSGSGGSGGSKGSESTEKRTKSKIISSTEEEFVYDVPTGQSSEVSPGGQEVGYDIEISEGDTTSYDSVDSCNSYLGNNSYFADEYTEAQDITFVDSEGNKIICEIPTKVYKEIHGQTNHK